MVRTVNNIRTRSDGVEDWSNSVMSPMSCLHAWFMDIRSDYESHVKTNVLEEKLVWLEVSKYI